MADLEVTRLIADVEVDGTDAAVADFGELDAAAEQATKNRTGKLDFNISDAMAKIAELRAATTGLKGDLIGSANVAGLRPSLPQLVSDIYATGSGSGGGGKIPNGTYLPFPSGGGGGGSSSGAGGGDGGDIVAGSLLSRLFGGSSGRRTGPLKDVLGFGGEGGGFLSNLLSPATMLGTLFSAKFGSLGSLAGFGSEHLLTTGLGIGGLGVAGGLGATALGATSLATSGLGMATNMMGSKQAFTDVKNLSTALTGVTTAQTAYNQAVAQYGKSSTEAQSAQEALTTATNSYKDALNSIQPVARAAVSNATSAWASLKTEFKSLTGEAVSTAATTMTQAIGVGQRLLPMFAGFATQNMSIVQKALQPLFTFLEGPGMQMLDTLETKFQKDLPTSIGMMTQAGELLLHVFSFLSNQTGGFTAKLDALFTRLNTPGGFATVEKHLDKWIADFHLVDSVIKNFGKDLIDIFKDDAGTATHIVELLNSGLIRLGQWIRSMQGTDVLKNLFLVHRNEIMQLMKSLEELLVSFGKAYLAMAPTLVVFVTNILKLANAFFEMSQKIPGVGQLVSLAVALLIIETRSHTLTTAMRLMRDAFQYGIKPLMNLGEEVVGLGTKLITTSAAADTTMPSLVGVGDGGIAAGVGMTAAGAGADTAASGFSLAAIGAGILNAAIGAGVLVAIAGLAVGIYELVKHFGVLRGLFIAAAGGVVIMTAAWLAFDAVSGIGAIVAGLAALALGIVYLSTHWSASWKEIKSIFGDVTSFLRSGLGTLVLSLMGPIGALALIWLHWNQIWNWIAGTAKKIENIGKDVISGLVHGLEDGALDIEHTVKHIGDDVVGWFKDALGVFSPSKKTYPIGVDTVQGLTNGLMDNSKSAVTAAKYIASSIVSAFSTLGGTSGAQADVKGLSTIFKDLAVTFTSLKSAGANASNVSGDMTLVSNGLYVISLGSKALVAEINNANHQLDGMASGGNASLKHLADTMGNIGHLFNIIQETSKSAGTVAKGGMYEIKMVLYAIGINIPQLVSELDEVSKMWDKLNTGATKGLTKIDKGMDSIDKLFKAVKTGAQVAGSLKPNDMQVLRLNLVAIAYGLEPLGKVMDGVDKVGLKLNGGKLKSLETSFYDLNGLFKQVSTTSKSATGVTAGGLGQMQVAITGITKTIQSLPGTVGSSSAGVVTSFMRMGSTVGSYFNSTFIPAMKTYGERLMEQLAAGITKGAPQVEAALNKSGVGSPQSGGALAGMSAGTENNYYIDTMNLEAQNPSQLAQQLQQKSRTANATGGSKRAG